MLLPNFLAIALIGVSPHLSCRKSTSSCDHTLSLGILYLLAAALICISDTLKYFAISFVSHLE